MSFICQIAHSSFFISAKESEVNNSFPMVVYTNHMVLWNKCASLMCVTSAKQTCHCHTNSSNNLEAQCK